MVKARGWRRKSELYNEGKWVLENGGKASAESFPGEEGESMSERMNAVTLQENLKSLGFTLSLAKPKMEQEVGRQRTRS